MRNYQPIVENASYDKKTFWNINFYDNKIRIPGHTSIHYDNSVEINIFCQGNVEAHIGGKQYFLTGNTVVFIAPNITHSIYYHSCCEKVVAIKINADNLNHLINLPGFLSYYQYDFSSFPPVFNNFDRTDEFIEEISNINSLDELLIFFMRFMSHLTKLALSGTTITPDSSSHDNDEITAIITWTKSNLNKKILLDDVATTFGYTKNYFCRKFKSKVGMSYSSFLTECRLLKARELFGKGYSIKDVASQTGFDDISYFTQVFRKHQGMTPKEFIHRFACTKQTFDTKKIGRASISQN